MIITGVLHEQFRDALNALMDGWELSPTGIVGPEGALVRLHAHDAARDDGHVDVQFTFGSPDGAEVSLWDCVSGFGDSPVDRGRAAAHLWSLTTGTALLELQYSRRGEFADHYAATDEEGFQGWHLVHGGIIGFGQGDAARQLQQWWVENPFLPQLAQAMADSLEADSCPHGIKIFFGGDGIAEVQLNRQVHAAASQRLAGLDWPRLSSVAFVRSYLLVAHQG
jgi:hypothetical protein